MEAQSNQPTDQADHANDPVELLNVPASDIGFGTRARKNYKDLQALANDFRKRGIIQPIAVKRQPAGTEKPFLLLAGGRRFSAAVFAQIQTIPCRVYPESLSDLDTREIELMENIQRADLTWPEEVWLTEEIHRLQVERFGQAIGPSAGHSASDTAKLLGVSAMSVSRDRALAQGLEKYGGELKKATSKADALRMMKKLDRKAEDRVVMRKLEAKTELVGDDVEKRKLINQYITGDFFDGVVHVPDGVAHLVEIDPPYGIDLLANKIGADHMEGIYEEVPADDYPEFMEKVLVACYRVMSPISWMLCWCGMQHLPMIQEKMTAIGLVPRLYPAIWHKNSFAGHTNHPDRTLASCYEMFIYASKGEATLRSAVHSNVFMFKPLSTDNKIHGTERPVELMYDVVSTFVGAGQTVMVPFLGSGNTLLAANNRGCQGFGWELHGDEYRPGFAGRVQAGTLRLFRSYKDAPAITDQRVHVLPSKG